MKIDRAALLTIVFFLLIVSAVFLVTPAFAGITGTQVIGPVYYHVEGNKSRSFYPANDVAYLYEGDVSFTKEILKGFESFGNIIYRATDDRTVDPQDFSIERMYIGLRKQGEEILLGDFYSNFSEYSLGNALKGSKITIGDEKSHRLILVGGIDTTKWEDLWEIRQEDSAMRRYVWGSRLENDFLGKKLAVNFNYGGARDDEAYTPVSTAPIMVNVFSIDGKYDLTSFLTAKGEVAQSFTDENTRNEDQRTKGDQALKFGLDLNTKDYIHSFVYSRVGNHFNTTGGFSSQDLETMSFDGTWFLPKKMKFQHYLRMDRNNLSKTQSTTTNQLNPGGKFSFVLPSDIALNVGADYRKRYTTDKNTVEKTYTWNSNASKDFRIFFATLGYTRTEVANKIVPSQERASDMYSLALDGTFKIKNVKYGWNIGEDIERTAYEEVAKSDVTFMTNLGLKLEFPSTLAFKLKTTLGNNNYYLNTTDSDTTQYYFSVSRNILRKLTNDNLLFDLSYERKGYRYAGGDNNYAETILRGTLSYKF